MILVMAIELTILQQIILGLIQGVTEWLPISSSGMITLAMSNLYDITNLTEIIHAALFLHLGTFFAALVYFRKDVLRLTKSLFDYKKAKTKDKKTINFLIIATLISGVLGLLILKTISVSESNLEITGKTITFTVAILLLITGVIQIKIKSFSKSLKKEKDLGYTDSLILGLAQGLASLPGISRSGITLSSLMLKKFDDTTALRLSFLMSLPIVLAGNIILNLPDFTFTSTAIYGLITAFVFGLATIHGLMKLSKKINFGWFVLVFAVLMLGSLFI